MTSPRQLLTRLYVLEIQAYRPPWNRGLEPAMQPRGQHQWTGSPHSMFGLSIVQGEVSAAIAIVEVVASMYLSSGTGSLDFQG